MEENMIYKTITLFKSQTIPSTETNSDATTIEMNLPDSAFWVHSGLMGVNNSADRPKMWGRLRIFNNQGGVSFQGETEASVEGAIQSGGFFNIEKPCNYGSGTNIARLNCMQFSGSSYTVTLFITLSLKP